jgi:hypothetical protein
MMFSVYANNQWYNSCSYPISVVDDNGSWRPIDESAKIYQGSSWGYTNCIYYTITARHVNMGYTPYSLAYYHNGQHIVRDVISGATITISVYEGTEVSIYWNPDEYGLAIDGIAAHGGQYTLIPYKNHNINSIITRGYGK